MTGSRFAAGLLFLDASVVISVIATRVSAELFGAAGWQCLVEDHVVKEVVRDPRAPGASTPPLRPLFEAGVLTQVSIEAPALPTFCGLVGASPPDDLGDGEAASIAIAVHGCGAVALDDGKARRICRVKHPNLTLVSAVDMFQAAVSHGVVPASEVGEALADALKLGRMRVRHDQETWVRSLVGDEVAEQCPSLRRR